jgi:hypothetical protein
MQTLVKSDSSVRDSTNSTVVDDLDFTLPTISYFDVPVDVPSDGSLYKSKRAIDRTIELAAVLAFMVSAGGYAVYALLSMSK